MLSGDIVLPASKICCALGMPERLSVCHGLSVGMHLMALNAAFKAEYEPNEMYIGREILFIFNNKMNLTPVRRSPPLVRRH